MKKYTQLLVATLIAGTSATTLASTYKCVGKNANPDIVRSEVEISFEPVNFRLNKFVKEDDGGWSALASETLIDASSVLKPTKIPWSACETQLNSSPSEISYTWSKGNLAAGHIVLDLKKGTGEFRSTVRLGYGPVNRVIQFSECKLVEGAL